MLREIRDERMGEMERLHLPKPKESFGSSFHFPQSFKGNGKKDGRMKRRDDRSEAMSGR